MVTVMKWRKARLATDHCVSPPSGSIKLLQFLVNHVSYKVSFHKPIDGTYQPKKPHQLYIDTLKLHYW